jgi:hypothetical protein
VHREGLLGTLHGDDLGVPGVSEPGVEELEPRGRLNVRELQVGDMDQAKQRTAWPARGVRSGRAEFAADEMRFTLADLHGPVRSGQPVAQHRPATEPAVRGQRWVTAAYASSSATEPAAEEPADTSTGSGRIVSPTRLPAGSAVASEVES